MPDSVTYYFIHHCFILKQFWQIISQNNCIYKYLKHILIELDPWWKTPYLQVDEHVIQASLIWITFRKFILLQTWILNMKESKASRYISYDSNVSKIGQQIKKWYKKKIMFIYKFPRTTTAKIFPAHYFSNMILFKIFNSMNLNFGVILVALDLMLLKNNIKLKLTIEHFRY